MAWPLAIDLRSDGRRSGQVNNMSIKFENLQPWVEMLIDALENRGSSSSGTDDRLVYPYAKNYRIMLDAIRNKKVNKTDIDFFLKNTYTDIMAVTTQKHRLGMILKAIEDYFYIEQNKSK